MPTGYTADVQNGKITEFKDFAMQCARAFGALVTMREDPSDAEIPDEFKPSLYHADNLNKTEADLAELDAMDEETIVQKAKEANEKAVAFYQKYNQEKVEQRARYVAMLSKVAAWTPPTEEHIDMKRFMREQLESSIKFDCDYTNEMPETLTPTEWLNKRRDELKRDIKYHQEAHAAEVERCARRTEWVKQLRNSLRDL